MESLILTDPSSLVNWTGLVCDVVMSFEFYLSWPTHPTPPFLTFPNLFIDEMSAVGQYLQH